MELSQSVTPFPLHDQILKVCIKVSVVHFHDDQPLQRREKYLWVLSVKIIIRTEVHNHENAEHLTTLKSKICCSIKRMIQQVIFGTTSAYGAIARFDNQQPAIQD